MTVIRAGLIGDHIAHSRFSAALALLCEAQNMTLDFDLIDSAERPNFDFQECVETCRSADWNGVSVTHPFKQSAAVYSAPFSGPEVQALGACNTLIFRPRLAAHNTDFVGFLDAWNDVFGDRRPGRVAMAGAGGVARAIVPALVRLGATEIVIWDSEAELAHELAERAGPVARAVDPDQCAAVIATADGLVNCTPMGTPHMPGSAFDPDLIGQQKWAFDAVYTPTDTAFLKDAANRGLSVMTGFDLFCHMSLSSFRSYTGISPDRSRVLTALRALRPAE